MAHIVSRTQFKIIICGVLLEFISACVLAAVAYEYPNHTYYDLNLAAIQLKTEGNYKFARDVLSFAISIHPELPDGYITRGEVYGLLHEKEKGIQDELKALSLIHTDTDEDIEFKSAAHQSLAGIYLNNKQPIKAESELKISLQLCPDDPLTAERLAHISLKNNEIDQGLHYLYQAKKSYKKWKLTGDYIRVSEKITDWQNKQNILRSKSLASYQKATLIH